MSGVLGMTPAFRPIVASFRARRNTDQPGAVAKNRHRRHGTAAMRQSRQWRLQNLFQETGHGCPRSAVRLLIIERAREESAVGCRIGEGMVGIAICDNLPIADTGG